MWSAPRAALASPSTASRLQRSTDPNAEDEMTERWYTRTPGDQSEAGPVATQAILDQLGSGELGPGTLVRRDGDGTWIALGDHLKFRAACRGVDLPGSPVKKVEKTVATEASTALWMAAGMSFVVLMGLNFSAVQTSRGPHDAPELDFAFHLGSFAGTFLLLLAIAWLPSLWKANRTQRNRVMLFFCATFVLLAMNVSSRFAVRGTRAYLNGTLETQR
jgi:hypothetical protein